MRPLRILALASLVLAAARIAGAAILVVPDDYSMVQAALDAAAQGDSILIRAGVYTESLNLAGKDVFVRGEPGGAVLTTASSGRVLDLGSGVTPATVLEQLIFQSGLAEKGAGVYLHHGAAVTVQTCRFLGNEARVAIGSSHGGAIAIDPGCAATLDSCSFVNNRATSGTYDFCSGGAVFVDNIGRLTVKRCRFYGNVAAGFEGGGGGAIASFEDVSVEIQECEFTSNFAGYGGAINASGGVRIERCRFDGNSGTYGGAAIQNNAYLSAVTIEGNVVVNNGASGTAALEVFGPGELRSNTIAFNGPSFPAGGVHFGGGLHVEGNIVAQNTGVGITCSEDVPMVTCNDVWANGGGNYGGPCGDLTGINGNISEDPLFCDPDQRNLTLSASSPCAASKCGLIGALPIGCPPLSVPSVLPLGQLVRLLPIRPNPATTRGLRFTFEVAGSATVRLEVFDLMGRHVVTLVNRDFGAGQHDVEWDGRPAGGTRLGPGVYVVVLQTRDARDAQRFVLTR